MSQYRAYFVPGGMDPLGQFSVVSTEDTLDTLSSGCYDKCHSDLGFSSDFCLATCGTKPSTPGVLWPGDVAPNGEPKDLAKPDDACICRQGNAIFNELNSGRDNQASIGRPLSPDGLASVPGITSEDCNFGSRVKMKFPGRCEQNPNGGEGDCCGRCWIYIDFKCQKYKGRFDRNGEIELMGSGKNRKKNPKFDPTSLVKSRWVIDWASKEV